MTVASADLEEFTPVGLERNRQCFGGGLSRLTLNLQKLYNYAKRGWSFWTTPTDGYDLVKYIKTKLYFYPHETQSYIIHWDTEYKSNNIYAWPWYHPSQMINRSSHRIIWAKSIKPGARTTKITLRPPAVLDDSWWFMRDFYTSGLFALQATLIDFKDPMTVPRDVKLCFDLTGTKINNQSSTSKNYWWYYDAGLGNGVTFVDHPEADNYAPAVYKDQPYYISLWGNYSNQTVWIWAPDDWNDPTQGNRHWLKLNVASLNQLIRSGPFVSKGLLKPLSLFFKYKVYWKFGGPSATEEINTGDDPGKIPPDRLTKASKEFTGLQIRDPATVGAGVLHSWEIRRGMLTARALQRLTTFTSTETHGELNEIEQEPFEEENSSSGSEADTESEWETET